MLVIRKPCIQYIDNKSKVVVWVYPVSNEDPELEDGDVTYKDMVDWGCDETIEWQTKAIQYLEGIESFRTNEEKLFEKEMVLHQIKPRDAH